MRNTIITWSGITVDPLDVQEGDIDITDIAHSLARTCRYAGHTAGHLSVARHSIWVANLVEAKGESLETQLWGLLHDAAEAYIGDMPGPLKHRDAMRRFRQAETAIELVVAAVFDLPWPRPNVVGWADGRVGQRENTFHRWRANSYTPAQDEADFLARYDELELKR